MNRASAQGLLSPDAKVAVHWFLLLLALATAFYMGLIPKLDFGYPLHVDEWRHLDQAQWVIERKGLASPPSHEAGFQILLVAVKTLTGLEWYSLFRWLPPVFFTVTVLLTYLVGRRFGCGVESALLAALIPTTIRFLGPAFLVPAAIGLLTLPLLLFFVLSPTFGLRHAFLCSAIFSFVGVSHPASAILLAAIFLICVAWAIAGSNELCFNQRLWRGFLGLLSLGVPVVALTLWRQDDAVGVLNTLLHPGDPSPLPPIRDAIEKFGLIPAGLFVFGVFLFTLRRTWRGFALVTSALALLALITVFYRTFLGYQSVADRAWLHLLLLMALIGGYGASSLRGWGMQLGGPLKRRGLSLVGVAVAGAILSFSLAYGLKVHREERYYHLVNDATLSDFQWIAQYLQPRKRVAILRPDLAIVYAAATRSPYYLIYQPFPFTSEAGRRATHLLFAGGGRPPPDTLWWLELNSTLIYAPHWASGGPFLNEVRPGVFILADVTPP